MDTTTMHPEVTLSKERGLKKTLFYLIGTTIEKLYRFCVTKIANTFPPIRFAKRWKGAEKPSLFPQIYGVK
jgi:hypothetical protein